MLDPYLLTHAKGSIAALSSRAVHGWVDLCPNSNSDFDTLSVEKPHKVCCNYLVNLKDRQRLESVFLSYLTKKYCAASWLEDVLRTKDGV